MDIQSKILLCYGGMQDVDVLDKLFLFGYFKPLGLLMLRRRFLFFP
jgi:hypothetical protein